MVRYRTAKRREKARGRVIVPATVTVTVTGFRADRRRTRERAE